MKISVQKYNPSVDAEPYFGTYEIEHTAHMTLLEALVVINDTIEPIAFDYSCRGRVCGRCAMTLNGTPCLACVTLVEDAGKNEVTPLKHFPVVRDLIDVYKRQVRDVRIRRHPAQNRVGGAKCAQSRASGRLALCASPVRLGRSCAARAPGRRIARLCRCACRCFSFVCASGEPFA